MRAFVFWSGIYNLILGFSLFFPALPTWLGINLPNRIAWSELIGILVMLLGAMLVVCARDLPNRAPIVYWEGIGRLVAFAHLAWFGFAEDLGIMLGLIGVVDLVIGLVYLFGLPRALGRSHGQLLWDKA